MWSSLGIKHSNVAPVGQKVGDSYARVFPVPHCWWCHCIDSNLTMARVHAPNEDYVVVQLHTFFKIILNTWLQWVTSLFYQGQYCIFWVKGILQSLRSSKVFSHHIIPDPFKWRCQALNLEACKGDAWPLSHSLLRYDIWSCSVLRTWKSWTSDLLLGQEDIGGRIRLLL